MNPSTHDLLEVVELVGSDEVVILPNNKNIRPVAEQVDALSEKTVRVVATGSILEGFAALLAYDPAAGAGVNAASMGESAARVVPGEVTRAVRDTTTDAGEVHEGDWIGISRDGVVSIADSVVIADAPAPEPPARGSARAGDPHRGGGRQGGRHPPDQRVAERGVPRGRPRGAPRRPASLPLPPGHRVGRARGRVASPRTLRDLSLRPVSVLEKVSARKAAQLEQWGVESVLDLLTTFPRRYIDRTAQTDVSGLEIGAEAAILAEVQRVRSSGGYSRNRKSPVTITVRDESGALDVVFFNQPWRAKQLTEGTEAIFWGKVGDYRGTRQMVNPVVDVVAGVDEPTVGRQRRTLRILPVYPASAKAGLTSWEIGTFVEEALAAGRRVRRPPRRRVADVARSCGTGPRPCGPSTTPSRWRRSPRLGAA